MNQIKNSNIDRDKVPLNGISERFISFIMPTRASQQYNSRQTLVQKSILSPSLLPNFSAIARVARSDRKTRRKAYQLCSKRCPRFRLKFSIQASRDRRAVLRQVPMPCLELRGTYVRRNMEKVLWQLPSVSLKAPSSASSLSNERSEGDRDTATLYTQRAGAQCSSWRDSCQARTYGLE